MPWEEKKQKKEELCKESVRTCRLVLRLCLCLHSPCLYYYISIYIISHTDKETKKKKSTTVFFCCSKNCKLLPVFLGSNLKMKPIFCSCF